MRHVLKLTEFIALVALCLFCSLASAADWARFRGPNGTGSVEDTAVPTVFGEENQLAWKVPAGSGNASPIVVNGRIVFQTTAADGSQRQLRCLDLKTGTELWSRDVAGKTAHTHPKSSLASGSAAADETRIVTLFWDGDEIALHAFSHNGEALWKSPVGSFTSQHGAGHSPILHEGKVILSNDQDGHAELMAFDATNGKILWRTPRPPTKANYSTPILVNRMGGPLEILISGTPGVGTYRLSDGKETWKWEWKSNSKQLRSVGSPLVSNGVVVFSGGNGPGDRQVAAIRLDGQGDVTDSNTAWETHKVFPYVPCMLTRGEHIYFVNDAGIAGCYVASTGEAVWTKRLGEGTFFSSPVMAAGRIFTAAENGSIFVFAASPQFELLATNQIDDGVIASPAIADGHLIIRGKKSLYSFGAR